ncbi:hypothetical protein DAPPUDRAFT_306928 [Daphnia pulex]|uniref:Helicase ATP-binding domain-containing protein n=1 Tax=Daphnia pulex TaxID=6669 RepID=E9GZS7_DAPPU|nr:hypothetical protein DAPPUDRAFT_306928 [Daphnia pulex]|eukprot:EFX75054.1 hypothetical protein DAPPUDRAFT_306928 [Daphnia pulex]
MTSFILQKKLTTGNILKQKLITSYILVKQKLMMSYILQKKLTTNFFFKKNLIFLKTRLLNGKATRRRASSSKPQERENQRSSRFLHWLKNRDVGLLIVPTIALDFDFKLSLRVAKLIIVSPEHFIGTDKNSGILDRLLDNPGRLKYIANYEAHLIFDWSSFRKAFGEVKKLKQLFSDCPKIAISTKLNPKHLSDIRNDVLKNPVSISRIVDRPNVSINVLATKKVLQQKKKQYSNVWSSTAKQIEKLIDEEKTIVYCSYAVECEEQSSVVNSRNTRAYVFTGKITFLKSEK